MQGKIQSLIYAGILSVPLAVAAQPEPTTDAAQGEPAAQGSAALSDTPATATTPDAEAIPPAPERLATVGAVDVTIVDLLDHVRRNPLMLRNFGTDEGRAQALSALIENMLTNQAAVERAGLTGDYSTRELTAAVARLQAAEFQAPSPSDDELKNYYEGNRDAFGIPAAVRIRDIFFPVPEGADATVREQARQQARSVLQQVRDGASLETLAAELSHNDIARLVAGDQGYRPLFQFPGLAEVTADMEVGDLSDVMDLGTGYQVFQLLGRREGLVAPFDEVKDQVRVRYLQDETERRRMAFLRSYGDKVGVTIHAEALKGAWDLADSPAAQPAQ